MASGFAAMLFRMNYINRWGLMRNTRAESLSEHSLTVALLAHLIAVAGRLKFGADVRPETVALCALYHDASEILTGDMPTPVKYGSEGLRTAYKQTEARACTQLAGLLPDELREAVAPALDGSALNERERRILKAADKLSALLKCMEEEQNGNTEFRSAKQSTIDALRSDPLPETAYFMAEFLPGYSLTLDELMCAQDTGE